MSKVLSISMDLGRLFAELDADAKAIDEAARPAAQAGAQVLYEAVKANAGALRKHSGRLADAIYQKHSPERSVGGLQVYRVSWNAAKAPHGHLVEFGYLQRYVVYQGNDGQVRPLVRPGMEGSPRPGRRASQAVKDAYYVTLPSGPRQVTGKAFVRNAQSQFPKATAAMEKEFVNQLRKRGVIR